MSQPNPPNTGSPVHGNTANQADNACLGENYLTKYTRGGCRFFEMPPGCEVIGLLFYTTAARVSGLIEQTELPTALARSDAKQCTMLWVPLERSDLAATHPLEQRLKKLQCATRDAQPVYDFRHRAGAGWKWNRRSVGRWRSGASCHADNHHTREAGANAYHALSGTWRQPAWHALHADHIAQCIHAFLKMATGRVSRALRAPLTRSQQSDAKRGK